MAERVAIVGGRHAAEATLEAVRARVRGLPPDAIVVSGTAPGVELTAIDEAKSCGLEWVQIRMRSESGVVILEERSSEAPTWAHYSTLGTMALRDALPHRNDAIAVACDRMVAFLEGSQGGASVAASKARKLGRKVEVVRG